MGDTSIKNGCGETMLAPYRPTLFAQREIAQNRQKFRSWVHDFRRHFAMTKWTMALLATAIFAVSGCTTYCSGAAAQGPIFTNPATLIVGVVSKVGCGMRDNSAYSPQKGNPTRSDDSESPLMQPAHMRN
jgi:hypothetical protein